MAFLNAAFTVDWIPSLWDPNKYHRNFVTLLSPQFSHLIIKGEQTGGLLAWAWGGEARTPREPSDGLRCGSPET